MKIAITGATGFIGRYLVADLVRAGHRLRCWHRPESDRSGFEQLASSIEWVEGDLGRPESGRDLVAGCAAVVHAAVDHPGGGFRGGEGNLIEFVEKNVVGTLRLIEAARQAGVDRFVFLSTCAVHEKILDDRPLDETHPLWSTHHYGRTRRPSNSSSTATDSAKAFRFVPCGPRASMAWLIPWNRAAGSTSFPPLCVASR